MTKHQKDNGTEKFDLHFQEILNDFQAESPLSKRNILHHHLNQAPGQIPMQGHSEDAVLKMVEDAFELDFNPRLNTSSYVNVVLDRAEEKVALMGLRVNLADQTVYPQSYKMHDDVVNMIANLWHCPPDKDGRPHAGAGTVGSTEACLLAGLALKFRWRTWYQKKKGCSKREVLAVRPNLIISSCYQAAWEKLFKYMDIEPKIVSPSSSSFKLCPEDVRNAIDENTIGVVCIMGNHYGGQYDPVKDIGHVVESVNQANDWQVGIHVDAASGGFIAPFQEGLPPWDFRVKSVLSISTSGHKYGESCCGTGWVVWRQREDLSEHVAIKVTYLGGEADSYTLNFSRPASSVYVQYYKLLRYGHQGYTECCQLMMHFAKLIRDGLKSMTYHNKTRFIMLDDGDKHCLPVVTAMLNPDCDLPYDDIDLQNVLAQHHWYVSAYRMGFEDPIDEVTLPLFCDQDKEKTMFRVVIKINFSFAMVKHLLSSFEASLTFLDEHCSHEKRVSTHQLRHKDQKITNHC